MHKVAFLTIDDMSEFVSDDELMYEPLEEMGIKLEEVSWKAEKDWSEYDMVVIRTTWDYQDYPEDFVKKLKQIETADTKLLCPSSVVEWNMHKSYLQRMEKNGVNIVPSIYGKKLAKQDFTSAMEQFDQNKFIIKPTISANADNTHIMHAEDLEDKVVKYFSNKEYIIQPYLNSINTQGEYSLIFFNKEYSHSLLKVPAKEDFRVQEEHGGRILAFKPQQDMIEFAQKAVNEIKEDVLFTRVDIVVLKDGSYAVMEVELIEPALYLRMDPKAPRAFAKAIKARLN